MGYKELKKIRKLTLFTLFLFIFALILGIVLNPFLPCQLDFLACSDGKLFKDFSLQQIVIVYIHIINEIAKILSFFSFLISFCVYCDYRRYWYYHPMKKENEKKDIQ